MATLPLRNLGAVGVVSDANTYDLPPNALSDCNNVIFDEGRVQRAPVFKNLFNSIRSALSYDDSTGSFDSQTTTYESAEGDPTDAVRFVGSFQDPTAGEVVFVCDNNGVVRTYPDGTLAFATPPSGLITNDEPWSHAQVAGISVLARKAMRPYIRNIRSDATYNLIAGDWPSTDTAAVVRSFLDFIIFLNITKDGVEFPTMVKWSNPISYGTPISGINWDPSNPNFVAGENVLAELKTPLRDGGVLGNSFIMYSQNQVWLMEFTGDTRVFNFRRLFPTGGIINTNCWSEVEGKHYVFGENDLYVHDGNSMRSIADKRVRRKVFSTLNREKQKSFYVVHDSVSNLIYFCYQTTLDEANYKDTQFCNKAAVYNYKEDNWSFMDLPNTVGGAEANITLVSSIYPTLNDSYELFNTNYVSFEGSTDKLSIMLSATDVGNSLTESRVFAIDLPTYGIVNLPIEQETVKQAFIERTGIDLDEIQSAIRNYKIITAVLPQSKFADNTGFFTWQVGATDLPNEAVTWYSTQDFYPDREYKLDMKVSGRYMAYRVATNSVEDFSISGFDTELKELSRR
jgi:hypothetical protein